MKHNLMVYILLSGLVSYLIRVLPLTLIRKPIRSRFIRSFLYYVPYATLAVMTFPAIITSTASPVSGAIALGAGIVLAWNGKSLPFVAAVCCAAVFVTELLMGL
ncbi:MAG: AzlD domain-containing protein [Erysipelotrichaceae bacterium]|jgi:branched-subunit amino acid transport protein|nr:AzlD domain-containing protein [Erysipelotrichaceae bacterium]MDO5109219.1 AzlD domain-containing protein [Erysipelotrichaceae bacterium]